MDLYHTLGFLGAAAIVTFTFERGVTLCNFVVGADCRVLPSDFGLGGVESLD